MVEWWVRRFGCASENAVESKTEVAAYTQRTDFQCLAFDLGESLFDRWRLRIGRLGRVCYWRCFFVCFCGGGIRSRSQLSARRHLAGDEYSIADIITWPWAWLLGRLIDEQVWTTFPNLKRWVDEIGERPAVQRGRQLHREWGEKQLSDEEQQRRQALLFNQTNESVRAARAAAAKG